MNAYSGHTYKFTLKAGSLCSSRSNPNNNIDTR
jgi:catalase